MVKRTTKIDIQQALAGFPPMRKEQRAIHNQKTARGHKIRTRVAVCHRRLGKTHCAIQGLIETAATCTRDDPRCYYLASTLTSAKRICWHMLVNLSRDFPCKASVADLSLTFPHNGARVQLLGSWDIEAHRGLHCDHLVGDELNLIPRSFISVFRPALADRKGKVLYIGTPAGRGSHFHELFEKGKELQGWRSWYYPATKTNIIDRDELAMLKAEMSDSMFRQEFLLDWDVGYEGAFYNREVTALQDHGRAGVKVPHVQGEVVTASFLPNADSAVTTFWQQRGKELHLIDEQWLRGTSMAELSKAIHAKPYQYGRHVVTISGHQNAGERRVKEAKRHGLRLVQTQPSVEIDQVFALKPLIENMHISEKCIDSVEALRMYRAEYNEDTKVFSEKPIDDWCRHFCMSMQAFAMTHNPNRSDWSKPIEYKDAA